MLQELSHLPPTHKLLSQEKKYYQEIMYTCYDEDLAFSLGKKTKLIMKQL